MKLSNLRNTTLKKGDTKKDRKGRTIYFAGYSDEVSKNRKPIELWKPEEV